MSRLDSMIAGQAGSRTLEAGNRSASGSLNLGVAIGLGIIVLLTFIGGLSNKPVAEDFFDPSQFLILGDNHVFRPGFGLPMAALQSAVGPIAESPVTYHVFALAVHLAATLAVYFFARTLIHSIKAAAAVALVFALYPRHHEAVFWPAATAHSLTTAFVAASFACYTWARQRGSARILALSVALFGLGMFSTEAAAVEVALLLAYEVLWHVRLEEQSWWSWGQAIAARLAPYCLVVLVYGAVLVVGSRSLSRFVGGHDDTSFYHLSLGIGQLRDFGGYLSYVLLPFVSLRAPSTLVKTAMVVVSILVYAVSLRYGSRVTRFGVLWIVASVLPYVLLVPFGNADRYFYLPSIGFCFFFVGLGDSLRASLARVSRTNGLRLTTGIGAISLTIYAVFAISAAQARALEWHEAGDLVDGLLNQIYLAHPTVDKTATFYFVDLPKRYKQAMFLGAGMGSAVRSHYRQPDLSIAATSDPAVRDAIIQSGFHGSPNGLVYVYLYEDGKLVDRSSTFGDPIVRSLLTASPSSP